MKETECMIDECAKPLYAKRLCGAHYQSARTAGQLPASEAIDRACAQCGQLMADRKSARAKFCGQACKEQWYAAIRRAEMLERREGRECVQCGKPIAIDAPGKAKTCSRQCGVAYQNAIRSAAKMTHKLAGRQPCPECGGEIPIERRAGSKYCSSACKKAEMDRRWRAKSPGYMRQYLYGITPEQFAEVFAEQDGRCAICPAEEPGGKGWHLDHCHTSGKNRAILCHGCNLGLGNFNDDPVRLRAAADYLEAHASS